MATKFKDSLSFYNELSVVYDEVALKRYSYIEGVNQILVDFVRTTNNNSTKWLDVACGNGSRTLYLMRAFGSLDSVVAIDNSINMVNSFRSRLREDMPVEVLCSDFTKPQNLPSKFALITTLWNVFGHLNNPQEKLVWLKNIKNHLAEDGSFFMDFNNRYNLEYGVWAVVRNILSDWFRLNTALFPLNISGIQTGVYVHSPGELDNLIQKAGLKIQKRIFIGYRSGKIAKIPWFYGQVLLQITHER